jgi:ribulose bisphosphate carboxylase small subunit
MASFDAVNYSLRPNKTIQRELVFDGLTCLRRIMPWNDVTYIGFGSIWFTDFVMAHKRLGIDSMISLESDPIGYLRAVYNQPFRTVQVLQGKSYDIIPKFYDDAEMMARPWIMWLDYDDILSEDAVQELRDAIERAPENSVLLTTVDASGKKYGNSPNEKTASLRRLLGDVVPDRLGKDALVEPDAFALTLARLLESFLASVALSCARPGGWVPAFRLSYRDKAAMATVGGVLTSSATGALCRTVVDAPGWNAKAQRAIVAPHLTLRELAVLQAQLPFPAALNRATVQALGFDLGEDQIQVFQAYYKYYPAFAQISA